MEICEIKIVVISSPLDEVYPHGRLKFETIEAAERYTGQQLVKRLPEHGYRHSFVCASKQLDEGTSANSASDATVRRAIETIIDKVCSIGLKDGSDPIDTIRKLFPDLYCARQRT